MTTTVPLIAEEPRAYQPVGTTPAPDPARVEADALAAGLRQFADLIAANPEVVPFVRYGLTDGGIVAPMARADDEAAALRTLARAALRAGGTVTKNARGKYFDLFVHLGPVKVQFIADRDEVCERVVVGTREVTEEVPDPDALAAVPKITVTKTVEDVEWRCGSLLAPDGSGGAR